MRGLVLGLGLFLSPLSFAAATFVVNSAGNAGDATPGDGICDTGDGSCTLRAAMQEANANAGADSIHFAIGTGAQSIAIGVSPLPDITEQVAIDGTTQPGYSGVPLITVDASGSSGSALVLSSSGSTIRALTITHAVLDGIAIQGGSNNVLRDNVLALNNNHGVAIYENENFAAYPLFTALTPDQTLTVPSIAFHDNCGSFQHDAGAIILDTLGRAFNEHFGMRLTATLSIPMSGTYNFDFTQLDDQGRLIIDSVEHLNIGGGPVHDVNVNLSAGDHAFELDFHEGGGAATLQFAINGPGTPTFSTSGNPGLLAELFQLRFAAEGNTITQSSIYDNGGQGIALSCCCVDPNDNLDLDIGPNTLLNHPVFANRINHPNGTITVDGTAPPNAVVEIFGSTNDPSGFGEGKLYLASVAANGSGLFSTTITLPQPWYSITATATDLAGNTSEFSPSFVVQARMIQVTNTNDFGPGSLRSALSEANFDGVPSLITFDPSLAGSSIFVSTNLNTFLENETTVNADINNDCIPDVEIFGNGVANVGLLIQSGSNTIRGLAINRFQDAVAIEGAGAHLNSIVCNYIGLNLSGTAGFAIGTNGVTIRGGAHDNSIGRATERNFVSAFSNAGVRIENAGPNTIGTNTIGLGTTGAALPSFIGVQLVNANGTVVGGVGEGNRIVGVNAGIDADGSQTDIQGNIIGWPAGMTPTGYGISVTGAPATITGNTITNNGGAGVRVMGSSGVAIRGNSIYGNGGLGIDLDGDGVTLNDAGDTDSGANGLLNFPLVTRATPTQIEGFVEPVPGGFTLELYVSGARDPSGYGEGETRVFQTFVNPSVVTPFFFAVPPLPVGSFVTALAIDTAGNTSEFSLAKEVALPPPGAVTELVAYPVTPAGRIALRWRDPQANESGFRIERQQFSSWNPLTNVAPNVTTWTDTTATPGVTLRYRVIAFSAEGDAPSSNIASATAFSTFALQACRDRENLAHQYATSPSVAWNGSSWAMAWADARDGRASDIFLRFLNADGSTNGPALQITNDDVESSQPTLVWNGTSYGLLWFDHLRGANGQPVAQLTFALLGPGGARIRGDVRVMSTSSGAPFNDDGDMPLIWDGSGWGIFVTQAVTPPSDVVFYRLDEDGDVVVNGVVIGFSAQADSSISVAWNGSEYGLVRRTENSPVSHGVFFSRVQQNGSMLTMTPIGGGGGPDTPGTSVVWDGSAWAVAWAIPEFGGTSIQLRLLDANGTPLAPAVRISDDPPTRDATPKLFAKPGGGYIIYTTSTLPSGIREIGRLEADAGGNRVGARMLISADDGFDSALPRATGDGTSFLVAWTDARVNASEIADVVVSASGVAGTVNDVTTPHTGPITSLWPSVVPLQNGFVAIWSEKLASTHRIDARFHRQNGTTLDVRPINSGNPARRPVSRATTDNEIAVVWTDRTTGGVHFDRIDNNGNPLMAGGVRIADADVDAGAAFDFDGEEFGVAWIHNQELKFQRMGHEIPIGGPVTVGFAEGEPQVRWIGSGWAVTWKAFERWRFARLDAAGALVVPPIEFAGAGFPIFDADLVWTGEHLGMVWSEFRNGLGIDIYFTVIDANGFKQFMPVSVVNTQNWDRFPAMYFDGTNFRIVYPDVVAGIRELQVTPAGTLVPGTRFLGNHGEGRIAVAFNGATTAMTWEHRGDLLFQTTQCLADVTPPPCPTLNGSFASGAVQLSWNGVSDPESGILAQHLYRDGALLTELLPGTLAYTDGGFTPGAVHVYELRPIDGAYLEATGCAPRSVTAGIIVNPPALPNARQNTPYNQTITASQGAPPYSFAITNGALPTGLTLDPNGTLSGTPTAGSGQFQFTVTATDNAGATGLRTYLLRLCGGSSFVIPIVLPDPVVNAPYTQLLTVRNSGAPQTWSVSAGALPPGLTLAANGTLSGTPAATGAYSFTLNATEDTSCAVSQVYSMNVLSGMAPRDVSAIGQSSSTILVRWTRPLHGETGFRVERSFDDGNSWGSINIVGPDVTSHLDQGLSSDTRAHYRVVAFNGLVSATSDKAQGMTFPPGPTKICAQAIGPYHARAQYVSVAHDGTRWAAVWSERTGGRLEDVRFQFLDNATGAPVGAPVFVTQSDTQSRFPMVRWNGTHFGVLNNEMMRAPNGDPTSSLSFALVDANGVVLRSGVRVYNSTGGFINNAADLPFVWHGNGWGVFTTDATGNAPTNIYYRPLLPNGDPAGAAVQLTNTPAHFERDVNAAWNGTEYGIVWIEQKDTDWRLFFARMQPSGALIGSPQLIALTNTGSPFSGFEPEEFLYAPNVIWNGAEWAVAWNAEEEETVVQFRLLNPDGSPKSATVRLSDDMPTPNDPIDDEVPVVMPKAGGGYFVFTASRVSTAAGQYDLARLTADAAGNRSGARVFLTPNDTIGTFSLRAATDGTRFLLGHDQIANGQNEAAVVLVDAAGGAIGAPAAITSGHAGGSSTNPAIVALGSNYGALWSETSSIGTQIYAKFFNGAGNLTATRFPLVPSTQIDPRFALTSLGHGFAVAWRDGSSLRASIFTDSGQMSIPEVTIGPGVAPGAAWNGEHVGVAFFEGSELRFQKMYVSGISGPKIFVGTGNSGLAPLVRWIDRGWAILWRSGTSLYFALLDRNGASIVAPTQVTFSDHVASSPQMAWNGNRLGLVWRERRNLDPPGDDIWFTALGLDGTKLFPEQAIGSTVFGDFNPAIYWDLDRFRVVYSKGTGGTKEIAVMSDGTVVPGERLYHNRNAAMSVASTGHSLGMLFNGQFDMAIESSTCVLDDTTAPPCPNSSVTFDGAKVRITWNTVFDFESGITGYNLYRDGAHLAELQPNTLLYDDYGFISGASHVYEVRALNRAFRESSGCTPGSITAGVSVNPATLSNGTINFAYNATLSGSGGTAPYTFAVTSGALPPGLSLATNGVISGTPASGGLFNVTITATDALAQTGSRAYSIRICGGTIQLFPTVLADGIVDVAYSQTVVASNAVGAAAASIVAGALPPGLVLDASGWIHGAPTAAGTYNFTVSATDSAGCPPGTRAYSIVVQTAGAARGLSAHALGTSSIRLRWTDPQRNETGFRIERSLNLGTTWTPFTIVGPDTTAYTDGSLAPATAYSYRVVATTPGGDAAPSNTGTASTWPATAAKTCIQRISQFHEFARLPSVVRAGSQWAMVWQDRKSNVNDEVWFSFLDANGTLSGTPLRLTTNDTQSIRPMLRWNGTNFGVMWIESIRGARGELAHLYRFALLDGSGNVIRNDVQIPTAERAGFSANDLQFLWDGSAWGFFETQVTSDGLYDHFFHRFDEDGDMLGAPIRLTTHGDYDYFVSAAWNGSEYGLSWFRENAATITLLFQRVSSSGTPIGSPTVIASGDINLFDVADVTATPAGWAVAWVDNLNGDDAPVRLQRLDAAGAPLGPSTIVSEPNQNNSVSELMALPSGEFAIFTAAGAEVGMLRADAAGNRIGTRVIISPNDLLPSGPARVAFDGTNFLTAFNENRAGTLEIASVLVNLTGGIVAGPTDLTSAHSVSGAGGLPQLVTLGGGFAALWTEPAAIDLQIHAKIFDGNGNLTATHAPLRTGVGGRFAAVGVGSTFAVASRNNTGGLVFRRYDAAGNPLMEEAVVLPNVQGSVLLLGFDGANYAAVWNAGSRINFQRFSPTGVPIGATSILPPLLSSAFVQMAWTGAGWAIVFTTAGDVHYTLLDVSGAVLVGPVRVSFEPALLTRGLAIAWNGDALGIAWSRYGLPDPPAFTVKFTVVGLDGIKHFNEQTVTEGPFGTNLHGLTWTGDRFRVAHLPNETSVLMEADYSAAGAPLGVPRLLSSRASPQTSVVWNGATTGVLWQQFSDIYFETTACLADATAPSCPSINAVRDTAGVTLAWPAVSDPESGVPRYIVYRDDAVIGELFAPSMSYLDAGVRASDEHTYRVTAVNGAFGESPGCTTFALIAAPAEVVASAVSASQVHIAWDPVSGAVHYVVERSSDGVAFAAVGAPSTTAFDDLTAQANHAYLYRVRAANAQQTSAPSPSDLATATVFTDSPLVAATTTIKSIHMSQLRTAVDAVRTLAQLSPTSYTNTAAAGTPMRAVDVQEVRVALMQAYVALGMPPPTYTDTLTAWTTPVKSIHLQEIRDAVK